MRLSHAYHTALRGDLRPLPRSAQSAGKDKAGWGFAAQVLRWIAGEEVERPTLTRQDELREGHVEGLAMLGRAALLQLDIDGAEQARALLGSAEGGAAKVWADLLSGHLAALAGEAEQAKSISAAILKEAGEPRSGEQLLEATTLQAIAEMVAGQLTQATRTARHASRLAQREHLWVSHLFVSVILARLRRLNGRPHLAGLVAGACLEIAPALWHGMLHWELLFAGVRPNAPTRLDEATSANQQTPIARAASALSRLLLDGEVEQLSSLRADVARSAPHRADLRAATAAMHVDDAPADLHTERWIFGRTSEMPAALTGLTAPAWDENPGAAPVVHAEPGKPGRRVLGFVPLEGTKLKPVGVRPARPEALAAALVLAGNEGITRGDLFAQCYGFPFRKELHEPSFKVMRHQARKLLAGVAETNSKDDKLYLEVRKSFVLPDPRCQQPLEEVMLRYLSKGGKASAKELAKRLDIPLRTVQHALQEMTEDGVCSMSREGRSVAYVIEDTTFCEVTVV